MKKNICKLLVIGWILSSSCSLFASLPVEASSIYDNSYKSTNVLQSSWPSSQCNPVDITNDWSSFLFDDSKWPAGADYSAARASFLSALSNSVDGAWGATQFSTASADIGEFYWTEDPTAYLSWSTNGVDVNFSSGYLVDIACSQKFYGTGGSTPVVISVTPLTTHKISTSTSWSSYYTQRSLFIHGFNINYPPNYEGEVINELNVDADNDGLAAALEMGQGTLDSAEDSDGDGLSDYIESQWYPNRQSVFCGTSCAYPNPTQKDLYVEVDWMKDGTRTIKPSATQLASVASSFTAQGITAHFDTGQYGGGNELSVYANELYFEPDANNLDFFDLKNGNSTYASNFNSNRNYIWHYMISGYKTKFWDANNNQWVTQSSGAAYPGDDDLFIAVGHIEDDQTSFNYNNLDTALSGTIIHEVGHTICLSSNAYTGQSAGCQFDKIDTWANSSYDSVMNYTHQMYQVDYSHGTNGAPNDHDDWTAVLNGGLKDFTDANNNSGDSGAQSFGKKDKKKKVVRGITSSEAKALKKAGKLGGKYRNQ